MKDGDLALIRQSWRRIAPASSLVGELFYARLFEIRPDTRPIFSSNLGEQSAKLMETLAALVDMLDDPDRMEAELCSLARRHVSYGVAPEHYAAVGQALLDTLATTTVPPLTAEELAAWGRGYARMTEVMLAQIDAH